MRFVRCGGIILLIVMGGLSLVPLAVHSHPSSNMELTYDGDRQALNVTISHGVSNADTYYIEKLEITKNDALYLSRDYTSQQITSMFTYSFDVPASEGDKLGVAALCTQYGSLEKSLVVNGETTGNGDTAGFSLLLLCVAAGIGALLYTSKK